MTRFRLAVMGAMVAMVLNSVAVAGEQAKRRTPPARPPSSSGQTTQGAPPRTAAPPRTPRRPPVVAPIYRYRPYAYDAYRFGLGFYYGLPFLPPYDPYWYGSPQYRYPPPYYGWGERFVGYGSVRLEIPQKQAYVYADGYFMGIVNEFDSVFSPLVLPFGPHRIDVRAPSYETLSIDVYVRSHGTTTYRGSLRPIQRPTEPEGPTS